jgi:hypothetical protein
MTGFTCCTVHFANGETGPFASDNTGWRRYSLQDVLGTMCSAYMNHPQGALHEGARDAQGMVVGGVPGGGSWGRAAKEYGMARLERVATLLRLNLDELLDRGENPEKMIEQLLIDLQSQFAQVSTQVAIAQEDLRLLETRQQENHAREQEWMRKAELAVRKGDDRLARAGLERAMNYRQLTADFVGRMEEQKTQVELLKDALNALGRRISEVRAQAGVPIARSLRKAC